MPQIFRTREQLQNKPEKEGTLKGALDTFVKFETKQGEKTREKLKDLANKTSWIPIFGDLAKAASSESDAVMAGLWGKGQQGEDLKMDERLKQGVVNHLKANARSYWATIQAGLLFIPEAALAKVAGSAIKGTKVAQAAAQKAEPIVKTAWKAREAYHFAKSVDEVTKGLKAVKEHGFTKQSAAQLGSAGLGILAGRRQVTDSRSAAIRAALKFGEKTTSSLSRLPEPDLETAFSSVSKNGATAPQIHQFAKILETQKQR